MSFFCLQSNLGFYFRNPSHLGSRQSLLWHPCLLVERDPLYGGPRRKPGQDLTLYVCVGFRGGGQFPGTRHPRASADRLWGCNALNEQEGIVCKSGQCLLQSSQKRNGGITGCGGLSPTSFNGAIGKGLAQNGNGRPLVRNVVGLSRQGRQWNVTFPRPGRHGLCCAKNLSVPMPRLLQGSGPPGDSRCYLSLVDACLSVYSPSSA